MNNCNTDTFKSDNNQAQNNIKIDPGFINQMENLIEVINVIKKIFSSTKNITK